MATGEAVAVQYVPEPQNSPSAETSLRADAGVRVALQLCFVMEAGAKAKTVTSLLTQRSALALVWVTYRKIFLY